MVEVGGDDGTRRRLPPWMQGKVSKPAGGDKNSGILEDGDGLVSHNSEPKKQSKEAILPKEKGETKRRKRKISQQEASDDVESASPKKMSIGQEEKQVREPSLRRKRKATSATLRNGQDSKIPSPFEEDDDEELTTEDLVSFAKEYVKADKDAELQKQSTRESESESRRKVSTAASVETKSKGSLTSLDGNQRSPANETTYDSTQSVKAEEHLINVSRTGDPAQDMLNLFLGPLLNKPVEEKRTEFITKDVTLANELGKGSLNDVKQETAPLTKKKGTLKDKVAMLLD